MELIPLFLSFFAVVCSEAYISPLAGGEVLSLSEKIPRELMKRLLFDPSFPVDLVRQDMFKSHCMGVSQCFVGLTGIDVEPEKSEHRHELRTRYYKEHFMEAVRKLLREKNPDLDQMEFPHPYRNSLGIGAGSYDYDLTGYYGGLSWSIWFKDGSPIMKLYGFLDDYRGEIGLDPDRETIVFTGNNVKIDRFSDPTKPYAQIKIFNREGQMMKDIRINGTESMTDVQSNNRIGEGIHYEYGYIIEVFASNPKRIHVKVDDDNITTHSFVEMKSGHQKFILIDDEFLSYEFYEQKYLYLLLEWQRHFKKWNNELHRQIREDVPSYTSQQKRAWTGDKRHELNVQLHSLNADIHSIRNSENIMKLRRSVRKLDEKFEQLEKMIENLEQKIDEKFEEMKEKIKNLEQKMDEKFEGLKKMNEKLEKKTDTEIAGLKKRVEELESTSDECSSIFGLVSPITSLIPGAGTITSALTGIVAATCTIAGV